MLVPIQCADGDGLQEWGLIELQGKIEQQQDLDEGANLPVGTLTTSSTNPDVVQLTVGYHQLEGKRLPLKKPLAILEKQHNTGSTAGSRGRDGDGADAGDSSISYQVVGIIRNKYLFKNRPRALISKPALALPLGKKARTADTGIRAMFAAPS